MDTTRRSVLALLAWALTLAPLESRAQSEESWEFSLTPYLWAAGVSGTTSAGGSEPPPINPGYDFFSFDNLDGFAFVDFVARKARWSINADAVYVSFADNFDVGSVNTQIDLDGTVLEFGGGYALPEHSGLELLLGTRGIRIDTAIELEPGPDGAADETSWSAYVGARFRHEFGNSWGIQLRADVGGSGGSTEFVLNALAAGSYRFNDTLELKFGYRYLRFDFSEDDLAADLEILGYLLGLQFNW